MSCDIVKGKIEAQRAKILLAEAEEQKAALAHEVACTALAAEKEVERQLIAEFWSVAAEGGIPPPPQPPAKTIEAFPRVAKG